MAQLLDVLFADLRSSKKSVNRLLSLGVLFALFGHFYIVEPYFQYKEQERKLSIQRQEVESVSQGLRAFFVKLKIKLRDILQNLGKCEIKFIKTFIPLLL
jgi:hypothetical protein